MGFKNKIKRFIIYFFSIIPVFFLLGISTDNFFSKMNGANLILCIESIFAYILFSKMNYRIDLYAYILVIINVLIENLTFEFLLSYNFNSYFPFAQFFFRIFLLLLILYNNKIDGLILSSKKRIIISANLLAMFLDLLFNFDYSRPKIFIMPYYIAIILSYYLILRIFIKVSKRKYFYEIVFVLFLMINNFKTFFYFDLNEKSTIAIELLFFISFYILSVGFFIKLQSIISKNNKLNKNVVSISNDIKEIKEFEEMRSEFFANISHELKTPLNILFSCIQLLESQKQRNFESVGRNYLKYEKNIKQNCHRLIRLTNNLVDITKLNSGFLDMSFQNHDIVQLVENVVTASAEYIESNHLTITFDTLVEELEIQCDSRSIERIILNLISNSIKFSNPNGNILVNMDSDDDYVTIEVIDDGIGIEEDKRDLIFSIFGQCDTSLKRQTEGIGIGLYLVKSLVELHNGKIILDTSVSCGTKIIIKLPNIKDPNDSYSNWNDVYNDNMISKISIEFSDIYDLY